MPLFFFFYGRSLSHPVHRKGSIKFTLSTYFLCIFSSRPLTLALEVGWWDIGLTWKMIPNLIEIDQSVNYLLTRTDEDQVGRIQPKSMACSPLMKSSLFSANWWPCAVELSHEQLLWFRRDTGSGSKIEVIRKLLTQKAVRWLGACCIQNYPWRDIKKIGSALSAASLKSFPRYKRR